MSAISRNYWNNEQWTSRTAIGSISGGLDSSRIIERPSSQRGNPHLDRRTDQIMGLLRSRLTRGFILALQSGGTHLKGDQGVGVSLYLG
jgi:hypothetical protein